MDFPRERRLIQFDIIRLSSGRFADIGLKLNQWLLGSALAQAGFANHAVGRFNELAANA
jgi:hypothetical protein